MRTRDVMVIGVSLLLLTVSLIPAARIPVPAGFPHANTTGITGAGLQYSDLKKTSGRRISVAGAIIEKEDIDGSLNIEAGADNVIIRKCRIRSAGALVIKNRAKKLVIEDCEIVGLITTGCEGSGNGIGWSEYTARRCNIYGSADGCKFGNNTTIEGCYIHDQRKCAGPSGPGSGTHNDGLQAANGAKNVLIKGNTIQGPYQTSTSAIIMSGTFSNITIEGNFLSGGSFTVYTGGAAILFNNNVWEKDSWSVSWIRDPGKSTFSCNRWHTGELITEVKQSCNTPITVLEPQAIRGILPFSEFRRMDILGRPVNGGPAGVYLEINDNQEVRKVIILK